MIEIICRAICVADGVDPDAEGCGLGVQMPEGQKYPLWKAREKQARAAIAAIQKPTQMMLLAAHPGSHMRSWPINSDPDKENLEVWEDMIGVILGETP